MKISKVVVRNYRCLKSVEIDVDDYSVLVGANGAGKSSLLYALDWFFNGRPLSLSDVSGYAEGVTTPDDSVIEVTVVFRDLSQNDRARLQQYGRGDCATFRRSWRLGHKDKVVGNALQGPGFAAARALTRVGEFRPAYQRLCVALPALPDLGPSPSRDQVHAALSAWESDVSHEGDLVEVPDDDASHMFGINGSNVIKECVRLVLIPAAADISAQVGDVSRGSALSELIGAVMAEAGARATAEWMEENAETITKLEQRVRASVESSTGIQAERVNSRLASLIPNASLTLTPTVPDWQPKAQASVTTDVTIDGVTYDVSRQGHGVQRAVMISMFEALAPDDVSAKDAHEHIDGEDTVTAQVRLEGELAQLPSLIVCIEEPEIYQHPIRARAFARRLTALSAQKGAQVIVATHSPYFIRPEQFASLRRLTLVRGTTFVSSTSAAALEASTGIMASKISKIVDKRVPTEFSEGFFADAVVLVEGDTDRAVIESIAGKLNLDLDARGISVIEVSSKESLRIPYQIFTALGVRTFVVADGDALGAERKHPDDPKRKAAAAASHRLATENVANWLPDAAAIVGVSPYAFGASTLITQSFILWNDDLESELAAWPSFVNSLSGDGYALHSRSKKDLFAYRNAVLDADVADLPDQLRVALQTIAHSEAGAN